MTTLCGFLCGSYRDAEPRMFAISAENFEQFLDRVEAEDGKIRVGYVVVGKPAKVLLPTTCASDGSVKVIMLAVAKRVMKAAGNSGTT